MKKTARRMDDEQQRLREWASALRAGEEDLADEAREFVANYFPAVRALVSRSENLQDLEALMGAMRETGCDPAAGEQEIDLNNLSLPQLMRLIDAMGRIIEHDRDAPG
jgi:hypothetical protein